MATTAKVILPRDMWEDYHNNRIKDPSVVADIDEMLELKMTEDPFAPKRDYPLSQVPGAVASNYLGNAGETIRSWVDVFQNPLQAIESMGKLITGLMVKLDKLGIRGPGIVDSGMPGMPMIPQTQTEHPLTRSAYPPADVQLKEAEQTADMFLDQIKEDWGGWENIKRHVAEEPFQTQVDVSGALLGAGGILGGTTGKIMSTAGKVLNPMTIAKTAAKAPWVLAENTFPNFPQNMVKKIYRLGSRDFPEQEKMAGTILEHGITPSESGVMALRDFKDFYGQKIEDLIRSSPNRGLGVFSKDILRLVDDMRDEFNGYAMPTKYWDAIDEVKKDLLAGPLSQPVVTIDELQGIKQSLYRQLDTAYEKSKRIGVQIEPPEAASIQLQKRLARAARAYIDGAIPEAVPWNERYSLIKDIEPFVESAAGKMVNQWMVQTGDIHAAHLAYMASGGWGSAATELGRFALRSNQFKSAFANMLYRGGGSPLAGMPSYAPMGAGEVGRMAEEASQSVGP